MSSLRKSHRKKHSRSSVLNIRNVIKTAVTAATGCFLQSNHQITAFSAREGTRRQYRASCNENISIETYYCWSSSYSYERGSSRHSSSSTRAYAFSQSPSGHPDSILSSSSGPNENRRQSSSSRVGSDSRRTGRLGAWARLRKLPFMSRGGQGGVSSKHQHHHSHHNSDRHPIVIGHAGEHHSVTELSASSISEALSLEESVEMRGKIAEYKIAQFSREVAHELEIILDQWYLAQTKSRNAQIISSTRSPSQINHETLSDLFAWYFERLITSTTAQHITNDIDVLKNVLDAELTPDAYNFALIRTPDEASHIDPKSNLLKMGTLHESSGIEIRGSQTISLSLDDDKDNTKESALQKLIEKSVYNRLKVWSTHMRNVEVKARLHNHFVFRALLRGQIRSDVRAKFDRLAFPNLKISGGGRIDVNGCALSLLSIAPGIGDIYNGKRYVQPFEFYVDCILNQDDIFQSSCIKNGLQNLLNRILRRFSFSAAAVESVEIMVGSKYNILLFCLFFICFKLLTQFLLGFGSNFMFRICLYFRWYESSI